MNNVKHAHYSNKFKMEDLYIQILQIMAPQGVSTMSNFFFFPRSVLLKWSHNPLLKQGYECMMNVLIDCN